MSKIRLLMINPNSPQSVTDGLQVTLDSSAPSDTLLSYFTAPPRAPEAIVDSITVNQTATFCYQALIENDVLEQYDGFLVRCFSDHPLTHMLRERLATIDSHKPVVNIFEASISHALLLGRRFAVVTTRKGMRDPRINATNAFLGATRSERFVHVYATGLGVVELREGEPSNVKNKIMSTAVAATGDGANVLILGCAGMTGMEVTVKEGVRAAGLGEVQVVDGAKAGVELLSGLVRIIRAQAAAA